MKKNLGISLIITFFSVAGFAQSKKCDCTIYPFKPDSCRNVCLYGILQSADTLELSLILGLSDTLSNKIARLNMVGNSQISFYFNSDYFNQRDIDTINDALKRINDKQVKYFSLPAPDRKSFLDRIRKSDE
jgi:hypothetical protein